MTTLQQKNKMQTSTKSMGLMSVFSQDSMNNDGLKSATSDSLVYVINENGQEEMITPEMIQSTLTELRAAC